MKKTAPETPGFRCCLLCCISLLPEQGVYGGPVFGEVLCLAHTLEIRLRPGESGGQIGPQLPHPVHHRLVAGQPLAVGLQQAVVIGPQFLRRGGGAAPQTPQQSGVPHQAPAQHRRVRSGIILAQGGGVLRREDVSVIHRRPGARHGGPGVPVGDALVKLLYTGRGEDDSGFHDWRSFLPVPMPYSYEPSLVDHAQELLALYDEGERKGIIYGQPVNQNGNQAAAQTAQNAQNAQTAQNAQNTQNTNYYIRQSAPQDIPEYKLEDFVVNGQLNAGDLQREKRRLQDLLAGMYDPANGGRQVALKNDGAVSAGTACVDRVRKDYFMHYPMLQRIVRQELEKQEKIRRAMEQLDQIEEEFTQYKADMTTFTNMVFYGMIECLSATGEPEYDRISRAFYKYRDRRGMETEKILVEDSKAFRFGKKYPLYEMFRSYRAMEPDEEPRQEMDEREAELRKQTRGANDHLIAAALEKRWNAKALQQLVRDTANEKDEDKAEIRRFYEELVSRILGYKDVFTDEQWTRTSKVASNPTPAASAQQAPARTWTVSPGGSTIYTVYSDRSLQMAWDAVNNTWVPLTAGMWVLNKAGDGWETIQLDAAGNITNG